MPDNPTNPFLDYAVLNAQTNMVLQYYKQVSVSEAFVISTPNTFYREHIVYSVSTEKLGLSQFFTKASGTTELVYFVWRRKLPVAILKELIISKPSPSNVLFWFFLTFLSRPFFSFHFQFTELQTRSKKEQTHKYSIQNAKRTP